MSDPLFYTALFGGAVIIGSIPTCLEIRWRLPYWATSTICILGGFAWGWFLQAVR